MKAHELIADPEHWTRHAYARNSDGLPTDPEAPDAVCWCALGAIHRCYGYRPYDDDFRGIMTRYYQAVEDAYGDKSVVNVNDRADGHPKVLAILKQLDI
jgi:hypothetical protein